MIGRVWVFQINPFSVAFFAAVYGEGVNTVWIVPAILAGMFTKMDGVSLLKYMVLFFLIHITDSIQKKTGQTLTAWMAAALCGGLNFLMGAGLSILSSQTWEMLGMSALESVLILAAANVYRWGIRFWLCGNWSYSLKNEELISILALWTTVLCAVPSSMNQIFSVVQTIIYLVILFMGYRYGAAAGTMTGAFGSIVSVVTEGEPVMSGVLCMLGISVGLFRKFGRIISSISFFSLGCCMIYFLQGQSAGIVELRAMVSAIVIFFALPKNVVRLVEEDESEQKEDRFAREDVRMLANDTIRDFADAFKRLSRAFGENDDYRQEILPEEMEEIYQELSEKICCGCANGKFCWDKHPAETKAGIYEVICEAGEESASLEVNPGFCRRCIRLGTYMEYASERMAVARMNLGWQNRLAKNREIMSQQMMDVSYALRSLTMELGNYGEFTLEEKRTTMEELKKCGVNVRQISMKRRRGRLEVVFSGCCKSHRCLTKTDLAGVLTQSTGVRMCPGRETRNVLSEEEAVMYFFEDTRYKVLTGTARIAKSGEAVSGDNYSFLELSSGEMLMLLADGMGSGEKAYRDSENFLEVLEYMLEAGFEKKTALQMLNTLFVMNYDGRTFTTMDMVSVNLHNGNCEILKNGAAPTFIKRKSRVEMISSEALPVGVELEAESDCIVTRLEESDMVVMVSDGVIDSFDRNEKNIQKLLDEMVCQNPNDMANQILMHALAGSTTTAMDDMSVLVAGLWEKHI
jgi:stage II sporulation protein E